MSADPARPDDAISIRDILRAAFGILRRHAVLFGGLALLLRVMPDLLSDVAAGAATAAVPVSGADELAGDFFDILWSLADASAEALPILGLLVLEAAVVLIAFEPERRTRIPVVNRTRLIVRMLPLALVALIASMAWVTLVPIDAWAPGLAVSSLWIVALPLSAAETVSLAALPGRLWALARGNRSGILRLVVAYFALDLVLSEIEIELPSPFVDGSFGDWSVDAVESCLRAALALFADAASVALYLALRRLEDLSSPSGLVQAFD